MSHNGRPCDLDLGHAYCNHCPAVNYAISGWRYPVHYRGLCRCEDHYEHEDALWRQRVRGRKRQAVRRQRIQDSRRIEARWVRSYWDSVFGGGK